MSPSVFETLLAMAEENCGCLFVFGAGYAADGIEEAIACGYATGPHQHLAGTYYEITPAGRRALAHARRRAA